MLLTEEGVVKNDISHFVTYRDDLGHSRWLEKVSVKVVLERFKVTSQFLEICAVGKAEGHSN